jgi:Flp pilus assembly protein TadD
MTASASDLQTGFNAHTAGRLNEARDCYERVLAHDAKNCHALYLLGSLLVAEKKIGDAIMLFEQCIEFHPSLALAHNALGNAWHALKNIPAADASYRRAIACKEPSAEAFCNLGAICRSRGELDEAVSLYRRVLELKPEFAEAWCNLGIVLRELGQLDEAGGAFRRALAISPKMAAAHFNAGLLCLLRGDFQTGWQQHEYRWASTQRGTARSFPQPLWLGQFPLHGKTILVHAEQGLGDTIQFTRYLSLLKDEGAQVVFEVQPALKGFLSECLGGTHVLQKGEPLPAFDVHCPLLSLPLAFSTTLDTIPHHTPYLTVPASHRRKWNEIMAGYPSPRIGLVWFGNRQHLNDLNRSISPAIVARFLDGVPMALHCLHKEFPNSADAALTASGQVVSHAGRIRDFSDTAALVEQLDLVISVDTSVAHLAGSLGKSLWLLLPHVPDWRWLLNRTDSPWYPRARLFRQHSRQDWDTVLATVRTELEDFCSNRRFRQSFSSDSPLELHRVNSTELENTNQP